MSTKQGRDYQEDTAVAAAIAAVTAASKADAKAHAGADARADAGADAKADTEADAKAIDTAIFDFSESIELDDEDVAKEVNEVGDGNVEVGGDISNNDDRGDGNGDGGGVAWERVNKKHRSEMKGNELYIHTRMRIRRTRMMMKARGDDNDAKDSYDSNDKDVGRGQGQ